MRARRFKNNAIEFRGSSELRFELSDDNFPISFTAKQTIPANQLIEEFMLLANMAAAKAISEAFPAHAVLRCHPPPVKIAQLVPILASVGIKLRGNKQADLIAAKEAFAELRPDRIAQQALDLMLVRSMSLA